MTKRNQTFLDAAKGLLGKNGWSQDKEYLAPFLGEWRDRWHGCTPLLALPDRVEILAELVQLCARHQVAITPQGGNTGLVGGQIPQGEVLVSTQKLNQVRKLDPAAMTVTVDAGMTLQQVQEIANANNLLFPMALASDGSATIGGAISTNAGGMGVLRYGTMRDLVLGLEVCTAYGQIWDGLSGLRKDNTGYDLKQVFIGAEGTLGIVTAATLRLFPKPALTRIAWCGLDSAENALALLALLRRATGDQISKFELVSNLALSLVLDQFADSRAPLDGTYPWHVLIEFGLSDQTNGGEQVDTALQQAMTQGLIGDASLAHSEQQAKALIALRENISAAQKGQGIAIKHDISLPLAAIPEFLKTAEHKIITQIPGTRICAFGHLGDGNLHYNLLQPPAMTGAAFSEARQAMSQLVHDLVDENGGSFSAEHGIGIAKIAELKRYKPAIELAMMRAVKQALDPQNIMNPRLLF